MNVRITIIIIIHSRVREPANHLFEVDTLAARVGASKDLHLPVIPARECVVWYEGTAT